MFMGFVVFYGGGIFFCLNLHQVRQDDDVLALTDMERPLKQE